MKRQLIFLKQSFNLSNVVSLSNIHVNKCYFNMNSFFKENLLNVVNNKFEKKQNFMSTEFTLLQSNCHNCGKSLKNVPTLNCIF